MNDLSKELDDSQKEARVRNNISLKDFSRPPWTLWRLGYVYTRRENKCSDISIYRDKWIPSVRYTMSHAEGTCALLVTPS